MTISKIYDKDIESLKVASLPSRPTAPTSFGGAGYTAKDMKSAFDRLPLFIISRLNQLIDGITDSSGVVDMIPSGISDGHTLKDLTRDITSGRFSTYLSVLGEPLSEKILSISEELYRLDLLIGSINASSPGEDGALRDLTLRISDIETSLTSALGALSELASSLEGIKTDIIATAAEMIASESEELESTFLEEIKETSESFIGELDGLWDNLSERIDEINARLEGTIDLAIDCGGPGNL